MDRILLANQTQSRVKSVEPRDSVKSRDYRGPCIAGRSKTERTSFVRRKNMLLLKF